MKWGEAASRALNALIVALVASVVTLWLMPRTDLRMSCFDGPRRTSFTARFLTVSGGSDGYRVSSAVQDETGVGIGEVHAMPAGSVCVIDRVRRGSTK